MTWRICSWAAFVAMLLVSARLSAAPVIDPISNATIPAGKSLILPVTASSPNGRPLTFSATSSTNRITVEVHTNNPFWRMSVAQAAASNAPGAFQTPFRGGVVTVTNIGDMTFMLFKDIAPHTVDVISGLTFAGFYTSNTIFHRVVPGFVIQGGDPNTNGSGGAIFRYDDEFNPRALFSGNGQLALANSGKDTDGSQFFITIGPQHFLDLGYSLFGQLLRGFDVMTNIFSVATNGNSRPLADVIITRAALVTNTTDTALTLAGTNLANVSGTIKVVADDGAGGRTTNSFTATTVNNVNNAPPILYPAAGTNRVGPINARLTNIFTALDLEGSAYYWFALRYDDYATNTVLSLNNGQLQVVVVPNTNYTGSARYQIVVSSDPNWISYYQSFPPNQWPPYDWQAYTFSFGDTKISAFSSNFTATALVTFTNKLLVTFTNGVANSNVTNFTATINWGDNSTNSGTILTNGTARKEVRGAHTYTNPGNYPVYITIQSRLGADATVIATATVPPALNLARAGTNNTVTWPAWAGGYRLLSHTNLTTTNWLTVTNSVALSGYDYVATNGSTASNLFFRLTK